MTVADVDEFYAHVAAVQVRHPNWRYGQTVFNCLYEVKPELAEEIQASPLDPFYKNGGEWVDAFDAWLRVAWAAKTEIETTEETDDDAPDEGGPVEEAAT